MPVSLGPATPDCFPDILSFWLTATEVPSSTDDLAGLTTLWEHDPEAVVVARHEDAIVGTLITTWDGWRGGFYRLAVHPRYRGQGIGRMLVAHGEGRLRRLGARRLSFFAVASHDGAVAFWRRLGYQPDPEDLRFVRNLAPPGND